MDRYELQHYGVKGMKWGVRRYQNPDGSLTPKGKKRISKQYKKQAQKVMRDLPQRALYTNAYNKAADKMNRGGIDKFNKEQETKYGKDYAKRAGYTDDYFRLFDREVAKIYDKSLIDFYESNKSYKKAQQLVDKYDMTSWDDLAKKNADRIQDIRNALEDN